MFELPVCTDLFLSSAITLGDSAVALAGIEYVLLFLCVGIGIGCAAGLFIKRKFSGEELGSILIRSENSEFLLLRYSKNGNLSFVSKGIYSILGVKSTDIVEGNTSLIEFVHEADRPLFAKAEELRSEMRDEVLQFQYRLRRPDGRWHWMHERQEPVRSRRGRVIAYESLLIDFSERLRFEEKQRRLLEIQRMITSVVDAFGDSDSLVEESTSCLEFVAHYLRLHSATLLSIGGPEHESEIISLVGNSDQLSPPVPIGQADCEWWVGELSVGEHLELHAECLDRIPSAQRAEYERCQSGSVFIFPVTTEMGLSHVLILESEDPTRQWEPEEIAGIRSAAEAVSRRIERLITERERAQFSEKRANIERSEVVSHFINGIIHDFNNLIFAVSGKLSLMSKKTSDPKTGKSLEEVRGLVSDAGGILKRLIRAGRLGLDDVTSIDPWSEMSHIMRTAQRLLPRRISFNFTLEELQEPCQSTIKAVPQTLQQLVLNLVVNARDAIGKDGQIRVEGRSSADDEWFVVTVHDDGPGIPLELREEAMRPYSSTKNNESSLGLGLSICRRVVSDAKGKFELGVSPLGGLMATAKFPLVNGAEHVVLEAKTAHASISGTFFLIEDIPEIRTVLTRELELAGAKVVSRPDAIDAEEVLREYKSEIVCMIFDIDLPRRTGIECLTSLRENGIDIPCLLITGGASQPPNIEHSGLLRKPFTPGQMLDAIQRLVK